MASDMGRPSTLSRAARTTGPMSIGAELICFISFSASAPATSSLRWRDGSRSLQRGIARYAWIALFRCA